MAISSHSIVFACLFYGCHLATLGFSLPASRLAALSDGITIARTMLASCWLPDWIYDRHQPFYLCGGRSGLSEAAHATHKERLALTTWRETLRGHAEAMAKVRCGITEGGGGGCVLAGNWIRQMVTAVGHDFGRDSMF